MVRMDAFVQERGDEQRHTDQRVPREPEGGKFPPGAMRNFVDEEHRAIQRRDRHNQHGGPLPPVGHGGQHERHPGKRRRPEKVEPVHGRDRPKPRDRNGVDGLIETAVFARHGDGGGRVVH